MRFSTGDIIELEIDCGREEVTIRNTTNNTAETVSIADDRGWWTPWRFCVGMRCDKHSVRILESKRLSCITDEMWAKYTSDMWREI